MQTRRPLGKAVRGWVMVAALTVTAVALSACGGQALQGNSAATTVPSPTASLVDVRSIPAYGRVLVTATGKTLYLFTADPPMTSSCTGSCVQAWPPLVVRGAVRAGSGADGKLLATSERSGGERQVFYAKHALYTYIQDAKPGMATGEGIKTYGGTWWLVSPSGKPVTSTSR